MIPGFDLVNFFNTAGPIAAILVVAAIIFAESGLLIGFFLPGDSILFTLGFLMSQMNNLTPGINIFTVVLILFAAAVAGDSMGYLTGRKFGPRLFNRPNSFLFKHENVEKAQKFYDTYGGKTILLARFIPVVRTFVPIVAGVAKMEYRTFLAFNLIGGALWTIGVTLIGFFLGAWLTSMGINIEAVLLPIVLLIIVVSVAPMAYHILRDETRRAAVINGTKKHYRRIVRREK